MWLIPTFQRPESLKRLLDSEAVAAAVARKMRIVVKYDPVADPETANLRHDYGNLTWWEAPNVGCSMALQWAFMLWPHESTYGFMGDDMELFEEDTLYRLSAEAGSACIAHIEAQRGLPRHPCIGGALIREWGFWAVPGAYHGCCDMLWFDFLQSFPHAERTLERRFIHHHHLDAACYSPDDRRGDTFPRDSTHALGERYFHYDARVTNAFIAGRLWADTKRRCGERFTWNGS